MGRWRRSTKDHADRATRQLLNGHLDRDCIMLWVWTWRAQLHPPTRLYYNSFSFCWLAEHISALNKTHLKEGVENERIGEKQEFFSLLLMGLCVHSGCAKFLELCCLGGGWKLRLISSQGELRSRRRCMHIQRLQLPLLLNVLLDPCNNQQPKY